MRNNNGYIQLHRKLLDNPILNHNPERLALWIHILLMACYKDQEQEIWFDGTKRKLKKGQLLTGRSELSLTTGINPNNIYFYLNEFSTDSMINIEKTNKGSIITVLNYCRYQDKTSTDLTNTTSKRVLNEFSTSSNTHTNNKNDQKNPIFIDQNDNYSEPTNIAINNQLTTNSQPINNQLTLTKKDKNTEEGGRKEERDKIPTSSQPDTDKSLDYLVNRDKVRLLSIPISSGLDVLTFYYEIINTMNIPKPSFPGDIHKSEYAESKSAEDIWDYFIIDKDKIGELIYTYVYTTCINQSDKHHYVRKSYSEKMIYMSRILKVFESRGYVKKQESKSNIDTEDIFA